jgi:hypothetical protein
LKIINQEVLRNVGYYLGLEIVDDTYSYIYVGRGFSKSKKDEKFKITVDKDYVRLFVFSNENEVQLKILEREQLMDLESYSTLVFEEVKNNLEVKDEFTEIIKRKVREDG